SEDDAAIEHVGLLSPNLGILNMMIYMIDTTIFKGTIIWWVVVLIIDLIYLGKYIILQLGERISPCCMSKPSPLLERKLEEEVRIAAEELERARSLRNRHAIVYEEANQRILEYDEQFNFSCSTSIEGPKY
ncbi:hypothetical protein L195_g038088, partial [Trifolium pratense]